MPPSFIYVTPFLQQSQGILQTTTASDPQIIQPGENFSDTTLQCLNRP
jgi:hypothetical protein